MIAATEQVKLGFTERLTQRANLKHTRYGWLRLTPAYSVHLVSDLLSEHGLSDGIVLDPFCGTGTTALVCAERGIRAETTDINPFLIWLARTKCANYSTSDLEQFGELSSALITKTLKGRAEPWTPAIHEIEKWWDAEMLALLGRSISQIQNLPNSPTTDLLKIVFCRVMIETANVSFGHQSMSFKAPPEPFLFQERPSDFAAHWRRATKDVLNAARSPIRAEVRVSLADARKLDEHLPSNHFDCVITSPPYPNRMSYIRELRPYMYWLGFLTSGRQAGELDWEAIGGTWGCATSNLTRWQPEPAIPHFSLSASDGERAGVRCNLSELIVRIAERSPILSTYVCKYFHDMWQHVRALHKVVRDGGRVTYIVGNSKFYEVLLPVEQIFAAMFREAGFHDTAIRTIRKRTSKKELYEYTVSATK